LNCPSSLASCHACHACHEQSHDRTGNDAAIALVAAAVAGDAFDCSTGIAAASDGAGAGDCAGDGFDGG